MFPDGTDQPAADPNAPADTTGQPTEPLQPGDGRGSATDPAAQPAGLPAMNPAGVSGQPAADADNTPIEIPAGTPLPNVGPGASPPPEVDPDKLAKVADFIAHSVGDLTGQPVDQLATFGRLMAPYAVHYGEMLADPARKSLAQRALRSINRQAILEAGRAGVALQQNAEMRLIGIVGAAATFARFV